MAQRGQPKPPAAEVIPGTPADALWDSPPGDGSLALVGDPASPSLYGRVGPDHWANLTVGGPVGATGATGPSGVAGASGASGAAGGVGATGASGPSGAAGAVGATGPTGPTGVVGATGASGAVGASGAAGAVGATGPSGVSGLKSVTARGDGSTSTSTTSSTFVDITAMSAPIAAATDDKLLCILSTEDISDATALAGYTFNFGATTGDVLGTSSISAISGTGSTGDFTMNWLYTVVAGDISGGNVTVKGRYKLASGTGTVAVRNSTLGRPVLTVVNQGPG